MTDTATLTITVTATVPLQRIRDMLCSAFEGGSNYWYRIEEFVPPSEAYLYRETCLVHGSRVNCECPRHSYDHLDFPVSPGGALLISDYNGCDGDEKGMRTERLDLTSLARGLQIMHDKYPRHYGNFAAENDDAETADVFLQCCLFGEIVYG